MLWPIGSSELMRPFAQGFAATIPESYLQTLQSFQGDVIDYIGTSQYLPTCNVHPLYPILLYPDVKPYRPLPTRHSWVESTAH